MNMKLGTETASLINHIQSSYNNPNPVAGMGATVLHWSDRDAYTVLTVSEDGLSCTVSQDKATRTDNLGMSDSQQYSYETTYDYIIKLVFRRGEWRQVREEIIFTDEYSNWIDESRENRVKMSDDKELWDDIAELQLVKGKTKIKKSYPKINIRFGYRNQYHDYSF